MLTEGALFPPVPPLAKTSLILFTKGDLTLDHLFNLVPKEVTEPLISKSP